jgi:hypothetical protein
VEEGARLEEGTGGVEEMEEVAGGEEVGRGGGVDGLRVGGGEAFGRVRVSERTRRVF